MEESKTLKLAFNITRPSHFLWQTGEGKCVTETHIVEIPLELLPEEVRDAAIKGDSLEYIAHPEVISSITIVAEEKK